MKRKNARLYGFYKDIEELYKIGLCPFSTYLRYRGWYNESIRPVPKKSLTFSTKSIII